MCFFYCRQQSFVINADIFAKIDFILHTRSLVSYDSNYPGGTISFAVGWHLSYFMSYSEIARKIASFADVDMRDKLLGIDSDIRDHIQLCMDTHRDLFNRQDEVSRNWMGIEAVDPSRLESIMPVGYEGVVEDLAVLQRILDVNYDN
jgi:hypothetical protein